MRGALGAGDYGAEYFGSLGRRIFQQEAGVSHHSRKQIIEVVSNAAGEQANAFQFLGLAQALLGPLSLSNIDKCSDGSTRLAIFPKQRGCVAQHVLVSAVFVNDIEFVTPDGLASCGGLCAGSSWGGISRPFRISRKVPGAWLSGARLDAALFEVRVDMSLVKKFKIIGEGDQKAVRAHAQSVRERHRRQR